MERGQGASADTTPAKRMLAGLAASIYKPREAIDVVEWADRYRMLARDTSADPGPWRLSRVPYLREPMAMFSNPAVSDITVMASAQTGKTEFMLNSMFYAADVLGRSMIIMYPTEDDITQFKDKRLEPSIMACPQVSRHLAGRNAITNGGVKFKGFYLDFAWARAERTQKGKARGIVYCDEIDEYPDQGALDRIRNRAKTFPEPKFVCISTPTDENFGIDRLFKKGDKRRYHVPCPACGEFQTLRFGQLRWEGGIAARRDDVLSPGGTWYECGTCQHRIAERFKGWMVARGVWVPDGLSPPQPCQQASDPRPQRSDVGHTSAACPDYPAPSHVSYQLNELYSLFPSATWGSIAAEFIDHKGAPPATFFTERLGEPYAAKGRQIDVHMLQKLAVPSKDGGYRKREIPRDCRVLLGSIDVQHNRFYYLCRGFGEQARESWLIDEREVQFTAGNVMAQIEAFIRGVKYMQERTGPGWPALKPGELASVPWRPVAWAVDSGDQTRDVYEGVVLKFSPSRPDAIKFPMVFACKGRGGGQQDLNQPHTTSILGEVGKDKVKLTAAVHLINVNTVHYKNAIDNEWRGDPRLGLLTNEKGDAVGSVRSHLPADISKDYLDHLTSEWWKQTSDKANRGWGTWAWVKKPGVNRNDFLDLEVYVRCLADKLKASELRRTNTGFVFIDGGASANAAATSTPHKRPGLGISLPAKRL